MLTSLCAAIVLASASQPAVGSNPDVIFRGRWLQFTLPAGWQYTEPPVSASADAKGVTAPMVVEATSIDGYRVDVSTRCEKTEVRGDFGWTLVPDASGFGVERIEERPFCRTTEADCLAGIKQGAEAEEARFWCRTCGQGDGRLDIWAHFPGDGMAIQEVCLHLGHGRREGADQEVLKRIVRSLRVLSPAERTADRGLRAGLEAPEVALAWRVEQPRGSKPTITAIRSCLAYGAYAVLWTDDGYLGGVYGIEVRARRAGTTPGDACAETLTGRPLLTGDPEPVTGGSPMGLLGHWLVLDSMTCTNVYCGLGVVDLRSGKKVFNGALKPELGLSFVRTQAGLTMTSWESIRELPCAPRHGESACWKRIRARVGIPSSLKVPQPDCEAALHALGGYAPERSIVVSTRVRRSLPGGEVDYLPGQPLCDALD